MLSDKQNKKYSSMSFEDLCDLIDEKQDEIEELETKINYLEDKIIELEGR